MREDQRDEKRKLFDQVVAIARDSRDPDALRVVLHGRSVDVKIWENVWEITPASRLAREGNRSSAEWLLDQGASIHWVARGAARGGHREWCDALIARGASINWVACGAARGGHREWCEELIGQGASISRVAQGAALNGHREWCEELIGQGADIYWVAHGAAVSGDREWCEALLGQGVSINEVAHGAAEGGHREWCDELIGQGASIHEVAQGAAFGGHHEWCEALIARGASINQVAHGAARVGHIRCDDRSSHLKYLSAFPPETIPRLRAVFGELSPPPYRIKISDETCRRAQDVSSVMREHGCCFEVAHDVAHEMTNPASTGVRYIGMLALLCRGVAGDPRRPAHAGMAIAEAGNIFLRAATARSEELGRRSVLPDVLLISPNLGRFIFNFLAERPLGCDAHEAVLQVQANAYFRRRKKTRAARMIFYSYKRYIGRKSRPARKEMIAELRNYIDNINVPRHLYSRSIAFRTGVNPQKNAAARHLIDHLQSMPSGVLDVDQCLSGELGRICRRFCSDSIKQSSLPNDLVSRIDISSAGVCAIS